MRIGVGTGLLTVLFATADFGRIAAVARQSAIGFLLLALLMALADRVIMAYKWNILLQAKHIHVPLQDAVGIYLISTFLGLFLPATVGGDAIRAVALAQRGYRTEDVLSSILVERIWGAASLLVMIVASIGLAYEVLDVSVLATAQGAVVALGLLCAVLAGLILLMVSPRLSRIVLSVIDRLETYPPIRRFVGKCRGVYVSYRAYNASVAAVWRFFLFSLMENVFPVLVCYFTALALHVPIPFLYLVILVPIILLLGRLPISIDGAGIHEGLFVAFLTLVGVGRSDALLAGLVSHAIGIIAVLPGGILFALGGVNYLAMAKVEEKPAPKPTVA